MISDRLERAHAIDGTAQCDAFHDCAKPISRETVPSSSPVPSRSTPAAHITADGHFAEEARHGTECTCNRILRQHNSTLASARHHCALPSAMFHRSWNVGPAVRQSGGPAVRRSGGGPGAKGSVFYLSGCTMVDFVCRHLPRSRVFSPADSLRCRSHRPVVRRSGEAVRRPPRSARTANGPAPDRHISLEGRSGGPAVRSGPEFGAWSGARRTSSLAFI